MLYNENENIEIDNLPALPETGKNYIINNVKNYSPFEYVNLSLSGSSTNKGLLLLNGKEFRSITRKCKGCYVCTNVNCNGTRPTSIKKPICFKCKSVMELNGSNCNYKIYHLKEVSDENTIQHILVTTGEHTHLSFPMQWRNKKETCKKIESIIIDNPSIKPSNEKIKNLQKNFINSDNLNKIFYKSKNKIFGSNQSVFSISQYELKYFESIDPNKYTNIYNGTIIDWLKPSVASFGGGVQSEMEYYFTIFPPLGIKILSNSKVLHVDVKHKRKNETENDHHLGILVHLEKFDDVSVDINCFVCDIFISHLTKNNFYKSFLSILEIMQSYGIDVIDYLKNLELIISDFSQAQREGIENAINTYFIQRNERKIDLKDKFSGCKFHFLQSVKRLKDRFSETEKMMIDNVVDEILNVRTISELQSNLTKIKIISSSTNKWVDWWCNEKVLNLLFGCLTGKVTTNNNIESAHSNFYKSSTSVQNYHELMDNFKNTYVKISSILNNESILTYTIDLKRKRFLSNLNKKINKKTYHHQDKSGNPPLPKIKKMSDNNGCTFSNYNFENKNIKNKNNDSDYENTNGHTNLKNNGSSSGVSNNSNSGNDDSNSNNNNTSGSRNIVDDSYNNSSSSNSNSSGSSGNSSSSNGSSGNGNSNSNSSNNSNSNNSNSNNSSGSNSNSNGDEIKKNISGKIDGNTGRKPPSMSKQMNLIERGHINLGKRESREKKYS
jgi:hypothetical protein